jgi:hypothetical protein
MVIVTQRENSSPGASVGKYPPAAPESAVTGA